MKTCMLDIEATNLAADFGRVLCVCIKPLGGPVTTISQTDWPDDFKARPWDDSKVVKKALSILSGYDVWVTYYGKGYDVPFLRTRSLGRQRPLLYAFHVDLYFAVKYGLRMSRRSLLRVQEHLCLKSKKTPLTPEIWQRASAGSARAYKEIARHCQADVMVLEEVFNHLKGSVKTLTRIVV